MKMKDQKDMHVPFIKMEKEQKMKDLPSKILVINS